MQNPLIGEVSNIFGVVTGVVFVTGAALKTIQWCKKRNREDIHEQSTVASAGYVVQGGESLETLRLALERANAISNRGAADDQRREVVNRAIKSDWLELALDAARHMAFGSRRDLARFAIASAAMRTDQYDIAKIATNGIRDRRLRDQCNALISSGHLH